MATKEDAKKAAAKKAAAKKAAAKKAAAKKAAAKKAAAKTTRPATRSAGDLSAFVGNSWLSLPQLIAHQDVLGLSLFVDLKSTALSDEDKGKIEAFVAAFAKNPWAICKKPS